MRNRTIKSRFTYFWKPRTIRSQLIAGLIALESLLLIFFAIVLVREQTKEIAHRAEQRLSYQINLLALQAGPLIVSGQIDALQSIVSTMRQSSTIRGAQVTDTAGRTIVSSDTTANGLFILTPTERKHLIPGTGRIQTFNMVNNGDPEITEASEPIVVDGSLVGYAWIYPDTAPDRGQVRSLLRITIMYGLFAILGSVLVAIVLAQSITRPLGRVA